MKQRTYSIGPSTLTLEFGDLTESAAEALVSSDDAYVTMGGGVSAAIRRSGGDAILIQAAKMVPAALGDVIVTTAGALRAKYIFHAITMSSAEEEEVGPREIIAMTIRRCLALLDVLGLRTIAFPAIGTGVAGFDYADVAAEMARVIVGAIAHLSRPIDVTVYLFDRFESMQPLDFLDFFENFALQTKGLGGAGLALRPPQSPGEDVDPPRRDTRLEKRKTVLEALARLDGERDAIEGKLASYRGTPTKAEVGESERRLHEIYRQRLKLLAAVRPADPHQPWPVFLSYAHADEELRISLGKHLSVLEQQGLIATWHDRKIAVGAESLGEVDANLEKARIILLLISSDFVSSAYCNDVEVERALQRHERGEAIVIPILLRPVMIAGFPFARLELLPRNKKAVTEWPTLDSALLHITEEIRTAITHLQTSDPSQ